MSNWHHAPLHRLGTPGAYMVTAATLHHEHFFRTGTRLRFLSEAVQSLADKYEIELEAWAVFSNHYHLILRPHGEPKLIAKYLSHLHTKSATEANKLDGAIGRKVWFQYRDTQLTFPSSYLARLAYVMRNPVKHGLVTDSLAYPFCSAGWFQNNASRAQSKMIEKVKSDKVAIEDEFEVVFDGE